MSVRRPLLISSFEAVRVTSLVICCSPSRWSAGVRTIKKALQRRAFLDHAPKGKISLLPGVGADGFHIHATIRLQASNNLGGLGALAIFRLGNWVLFALTFGVDAVLFDTLGDQVGLHGFSAL